MKQQRVDIIIPIYNAYHDLVKCINSIKKWTDMDRHRLVLVNDCSLDTRIAPYLEQTKEEIGSCVVIHNDKNKGFSANVNLGMAQSEDRDVILLNSDTVVTKDWVEKLLRCAYSDPWIATATPLSNNATLCSVPYFCEENRLPDGYTVDAYAELVEKVSLRKYPEIPVAHGFCMFIKREAIDTVGNFDAETFGKGYGEENDFCCRAIEAGYYHAMCDDTFILHTGTSSFVDEDKSKYMAEHEQILEGWYPELMQAVRVHCRDNPTSMISDNVRMRTALEGCKQRKTILYLLQWDFREDADNHIGGTQLHVKDLVNGLKDRYNLVVAARNLDWLNVTFYPSGQELFFQFHIGGREKFERFRSAEFAKLYGNILDAFHADCVHIHHVMDLTLELYYEAEKRNIPVFTTLHDYYYVCPNYLLLDESNRFCMGREHRSCKSCLKAHLGIAETVDYITIWRKQHCDALKMSERIFVPSQSVCRMIETVYPDLEGKIRVIEHGSAYTKMDANKSGHHAKRSFHVAFLGAIYTAKGLGCVTELIQKGNSGIDWYLFGYLERAVPGLAEKANFHDMGAYQRDSLPALLGQNEIDLACILPICPETFCYTLSEAVAAGVPVLVSDIGALGERVRRMGCGWVMPYCAPSDEVLSRILSLKEDRKEYQAKLENVRKLRLKTVEEMCQEYAGIYQEAFLEEGGYRRGQIDNGWLIAGYLARADQQSAGKELKQGRGQGLSGSLEQGQGLSGRQEQDRLSQDRLEDVQRQLDEIRNSFSYRMALKLAVRVPFRRQIKAGLLGIYRMFRK